jgi:hypothetical protein
MLHLLQDPHGFMLEKWHGFFATTILATLAAIRLYLNRKKPLQDIHESTARIGKLAAESRQVDADAAKSFSETMMVMLSKISDLTEGQAQMRERHAKQVEFLQSQVEIKTAAEQDAMEKEQIARERSHRAIAEIQRCIMAIRDYEEMLRGDDVKFEAFDFKPYEEIMKMI